VAQTPEIAPFNLGFLAIVRDSSGYLGGYLVTNAWGRPLEFRLSTAVQPNRIQQILYGGTLQSYICADLIGKTLVEKTSVSPQCLVTDQESVLDLRLSLEVPVLWLAPANDPLAEDLAEDGAAVRAPTVDRGPILCHPRFPADIPAGREILNRLEGILDLAEPFGRIREAMGEARKQGVASRG
jgi:hypothetical protein